MLHSSFSALVNYFGVYELLLAALTAAAILVAFRAPAFASKLFASIERNGARLASRPILTIIGLAVCAVILRSALIPVLGTPQPVIPDEVSLLLQADTYASGRIDNPSVTPSFSSFYTLVSPTYASTYPVLRSLPMAIAQSFGFGPWIGIFAINIILVIAVYFMVRSYFSVELAILMSLIVILRFCLFNFWINSYLGPTITALGGVLLVYGYKKISIKRTLAAGLVVGVGLFFLMTTRPYEGFVFSIPFVVAISIMIFRESRKSMRAAAMAAFFPTLLTVAGLGLTVVHNNAVTGDWRIAPYELYRQQAAQSPALLVQSFESSKKPTYDLMQRYFDWEGSAFEKEQSTEGLLRNELRRAVNYLSFYVGSALLIPFVWGLWTFRRERTFMAAGVISIVGLGLEVWNHAHYASPAFGLFILAIAAGFSKLRGWRPASSPVGLALSRLLILALLVGTIYPMYLLTATQEISAPDAFRSCCWLKTTSNIHENVASYIKQTTNENAILFVDTGPRSPIVPIIYNRADLNKAPVVWVNDDPRYNEQVFKTYDGRKLWRLDWRSSALACLRPAHADAGAILPLVGEDGCVAFPLNIDLGAQ
jgi:hypothetical protein